MQVEQRYSECTGARYLPSPWLFLPSFLSFFLPSPNFHCTLIKSFLSTGASVAFTTHQILFTSGYQNGPFLIPDQHLPAGSFTPYDSYNNTKQSFHSYNSQICYLYFSFTTAADSQTDSAEPLYVHEQPSSQHSSPESESSPAFP